MKKLQFFCLVTGFLAMLMPQQADAYLGICCSKCGGNMPMNIAGGGVPETYEFRFKINPEMMRMEGLRSGLSRVDESSLLGNPAAGKFMAVPQDMDMAMLNVSVGYSVSERFFAGIMGMYAKKDMDMRFNNVMKTMAGQAGFIMRSRGLSDTMVMGKYLLWADDVLIPSSQLSMFGAFSLPTGSINQRNDEHPLLVRQKELLPYGMQLGSGTYDPTLGLLYQGSSSPFWWGLNGMYTARLHDNSRNYRLGNKARFDVYLMHQPRVDTVLEVQLNGEWKGRIKGQADEALSGASGHAVQGNGASPFMTPLWNTNNYGGTQLFATVGVQWQPLPLNIINLQVSVPLYRRLNGVQLETDWRISLTWYMELPTDRSIRSQKQGHTPAHLGF